MKLKKYEASTEQEAIEMVKNELGKDALILNVKKVQHKGIFSIFKKPTIEVTAAYEDNPVTEEKSNKAAEQIQRFEQIKASVKAELDNSKMQKQEQTINELEKKLSDTQALLNKVTSELSVKAYNSEGKIHKYENTMLQFFYDKLIEHEVTKSLAEKLLSNIENVSDLDKLDINLIVKVVYNRIIKILGEPKIIDVSNLKFNNAKNIVFIGPTGVGKTTTIAKLSSNFIIENGLSVGFITCDTYRIAAVEQLKTYAEILGCDVGVVYENKDVKSQIDDMKAIHDFIFIDTAGRSHKKRENIEDLKELLSFIDTYEVYLVLSITTKYDDLIETINAYSEITDFKIIFTKLDETNCLGSILNIRYETDKEISYITNGQNVPDDLDIIKPEKIAKALLGSMYE